MLYESVHCTDRRVTPMDMPMFIMCAIKCVRIYIFGSLWRWSRGQQNRTPSPLNRLYLYLYLVHIYTQNT